MLKTLMRESTWKNFPRTLSMATKIARSVPKKTKDAKVKALIDETQVVW
jgi:hypothetical protein